MTATPVSHQQPQAAPAAADTTQVLPVGTWGLGLAPRAAGMAPPAVLAAAAAAAEAACAAAAAAAAVAPAPAPIMAPATRKEKNRLLMQKEGRAKVKRGLSGALLKIKPDTRAR